MPVTPTAADSGVVAPPAERETTTAVTRLLECSDPARAHAVTLDSGRLLVDPIIFVREGHNCPVNTTSGTSSPAAMALAMPRDQRIAAATISPDNRIMAVGADVADPHTLRSLLLWDVGATADATTMASKALPEPLQLAQTVRGLIVFKDAATGKYKIDIVMITAAGTSVTAHCELSNNDEPLTCTDLPAATR